jgi:hypothetical protein
MQTKTKALLGLFLVGIAPTISVIASFGTGDGVIGKIAWTSTKLWMFGLPLLWHLKVDKKPLSWSRPIQGGFKEAMFIGGVFSVIMIGAWILFGIDKVDSASLRNAVQPFGLTNVFVYIAAASFWILINSVLEEFVFRWFIVEKLSHLSSSKNTIIILSALIFVLHHFFALWFLGFPIGLNLLACFGLFVGGCSFSWLYIKFESIWIPYITHALCDIVVFSIGYWIIFIA